MGAGRGCRWLDDQRPSVLHWLAQRAAARARFEEARMTSHDDQPPRHPALHASPRSGAEPFHAAGRALGFDLLSFWRWSASDLVDNTARGVLAEYLVGRALDVDLSGVRQPWAPCDLRTRDGVTIEVKTSAYLQAWGQAELTEPAFGIRPTRGWDHEAGASQSIPGRRTDVYVFALLAHQDKATLDPTNVEQWRFRVVPTRELEERFGTRERVTLRALGDAHAWVRWEELEQELVRAVRGGGGA